MTFNELINEAMAAAQEGRLQNKSEDELAALLQACLRYCASNPHSRVFDPTLDSLRDEIKRRANEKAQIETDKKHNAAMGQGKNHHKETMDEIGELKTSVDLVKKSVDHLAHPRWIDWAILIVGAIAAIAAVIALISKH